MYTPTVLLIKYLLELAYFSFIILWSYLKNSTEPKYGVFIGYHRMIF